MNDLLTQELEVLAVTSGRELVPSLLVTGESYLFPFAKVISKLPAGIDLGTLSLAIQQGVLESTSLEGVSSESCGKARAAGGSVFQRCRTGGSLIVNQH